MNEELTSSKRCPWCGTDPKEAAARHEGPHATWCVHFRESQRAAIQDKARFQDQALDGAPSTSGK